MPSKSTAAHTQADTNTSTAVERDNVMSNGQMISDSIVIDPSDKTMQAIVAGFTQDFQTLMNGQTASTQSMVSLAGDVLKAADSNQIKMTEFGYNALKQAYDFLTESLAQGKYTLDFASHAVDQSYSLTNRVVGGNQDTVNQAFQLLGDVKTGDFSGNLKFLSAMVMMFALGAIYLMQRGKA